MVRKIVIVVTVMALLTGLIGCGGSATKDLSKKNASLQSRVDLLEETLLENGISLPEDTVATTEENIVEAGTVISDNPVKSGKFSEITLEVVGKINTESNYSEFVQLPYKVINRYNKEIKGIQGIMHIKDMFDVEIMSVGWDIASTPIPVNGYIEENGFGIEINQFMDDHMKVYNTTYENLIFEYEVTKVLFSDGTIIE